MKGGDSQRLIDDVVENYHNPNENKPFKDRLGLCYELAGRFANYNDGVTLVHGSIAGFGKPRIDHAWVELNQDDVWEPTGNKIWPKIAFDSLFNPKESHRYSSDEVNINILKHENWGPWDE